jgi:GGDEF domain-containing protein
MIRAKIVKNVIELGKGISISAPISIGGASCPQNEMKVSDIILSADKALYTAKETGGNNLLLPQ